MANSVTKAITKEIYLIPGMPAVNRNPSSSISGENHHWSKTMGFSYPAYEVSIRVFSLAMWTRNKYVLLPTLGIGFLDFLSKNENSHLKYQILDYIIFLLPKKMFYSWYAAHLNLWKYFKGVTK